MPPPAATAKTAALESASLALSLNRSAPGAVAPAPGAPAPTDSAPTDSAPTGSVSAEAAPAGDPLVGQVLDERYRVVRKLGEGAMGAVYEVRHQRLDKRFAMKVIHRELAQIPEFVARFEREALSSSRLTHPNIISVTDFGRASSGELFLVMEFVEGQSISDLIYERPLPINQALEITRQVLLGLQHAHQAGIVHRDIKPDNVMRVSAEEETWRVKILDFGIAKAPITDAGAQLTQAGVIFGTPQYMAPEQAMSAAVDARADLYAVGAMLWKMLTARPLFAGEGPVEVITAKLTSRAPTLEQVAPGLFSPRLQAFLQRALEAKPSERFASAEEMLEALARVQRDPGGGLALSDESLLRRALDRCKLLLASMRPAACWLLAQLKKRAEQARQLFIAWYRCESQSAQPPTWPLRLRGLVTTWPGRAVLTSGLLVLGALLLLLIPADEKPTAAPPGSSPRAARSWLRASHEPTPVAVPGVSPRVERGLHRVQAFLDRGDCRQALVEARVVLRENPKLAAAHYLLGAASFCRREYLESLAAYERAIALDASFGRDARILEHARELLETRKLRDEALEFLGARVRKPALPLLLELASTSPQLKVRQRAVEFVTQLGAGDRIDWVASLSLDLMQLPECEQRAQVLPRLLALRDSRVLPVLRKARDKTVRRSVFWRGYYNACFRKQLGAAIEQLERQ